MVEGESYVVLPVCVCDEECTVRVVGAKCLFVLFAVQSSFDEVLVQLLNIILCVVNGTYHVLLKPDSVIEVSGECIMSK